MARGLVDAVSILSLGRVFVANMTGNVIFVGFAIARAPGFSLTPSVVAVAGSLAGAAAGGETGRHLGADQAVLLAAVVAGELALIALAAAVAGEPFAALTGDLLAGLCALRWALRTPSHAGWRCRTSRRRC